MIEYEFHNSEVVCRDNRKITIEKVVKIEYLGVTITNRGVQKNKIEKKINKMMKV